MKATSNVVTYLRNSIAASSNPKIDFSQGKYHPIKINEIESSQVLEGTYQVLFEEFWGDMSQDKKDKTTEINVLICPKIAKLDIVESKRTEANLEALTGLFFIPATLDKLGRLAFNKEDGKYPWFPREFLEPMIEPLLSIGSIAEIDTFLSDNIAMLEKITTWPEYLAFIKFFYQFVTSSDFDSESIIRHNNKILLTEDMYIFLDSTINSTFHIMDLYNKLRKDGVSSALLDNFLELKEKPSVPLVENNIAQMQLHTGQMNGEYALSPSQREVMNHMHQLEGGEILAVNGPPGTGKTTLLQSVVANMYVDKALKEEMPPIIVASSTNNQAVTNIIESFGNIEKVGIGVIEERWLTGINSFATYFNSKSRPATGKGYQCTDNQGRLFVKEMESDANLESSKAKFGENFSKYFGKAYVSLEDSRRTILKKLRTINDSKNEFLCLVEEIKLIIGDNTHINEYIRNLDVQIESSDRVAMSARKRIEDWKSHYHKLPWVVRLLSPLGLFSSKIKNHLQQNIESGESRLLKPPLVLNEIEGTYSQLIYDEVCKIDELHKQKELIERLSKRWNEMLVSFKHLGIDLFGGTAVGIDLEALNQVLDSKVRYTEFWLAVHYYEARWLNGDQKCTENQKGKTFKGVLELYFNRLCMITPCLVMTFFMLPKQFKCYVAPNNYEYMYQFIDLLIVDEAGQVSPDIAAPSFALAKNALVVGDVHQIAPVWNLTKPLDTALAISSKIIDCKEGFDQLSRIGVNCSESSVMRVAAKACRYEKFGKGLFLSEHRRCYDEIISYCNDLVYDGNLIPLRGSCKNVETKLDLPPIGYKQISSFKSVRIGTSRQNKEEARAIVDWIISQFDRIERAYPNEKLDNLVGVVTPFKAQAILIKRELKSRSFKKYEHITVGTVHTFQGAERKVIIFSSVYGSEDGCYFMDASPSMMNVAVSRAKDHFFVFGEMECMDFSSTSASGLLRSYLIGNEIY
ncbi:DNA helicase [Listeria booriae]|uniref:AAA domain-containing protein n=1 Tax=Listeria booriae TaxID=1552123 RepID=UPI0016236497|nr:AAA domain-containing protein [Listeria booriae]MBC1230610.1 DNA helicase [Listeria booriae]